VLLTCVHALVKLAFAPDAHLQPRASALPHQPPCSSGTGATPMLLVHQPAARRRPVAPSRALAVSRGRSLLQHKRCNLQTNIILCFPLLSRSDL
jgi:hypothetical protein